MLTIEFPYMTETEFLLTTSGEYYADKQRGWRKISVRGFFCWSNIKFSELTLWTLSQSSNLKIGVRGSVLSWFPGIRLLLTFHRKSLVNNRWIQSFPPEIFLIDLIIPARITESILSDLTSMGVFSYKRGITWTSVLSKIKPVLYYFLTNIYLQLAPCKAMGNCQRNLLNQIIK